MRVGIGLKAWFCPPAPANASTGERQHRRTPAPANASTGERQGALVLFRKVKAAPWSQDLTLIWADEGFAGADFEAQVRCEFGWKVDIGHKEPGQKGFCVQRKRWLIEQLFGCWGRYRRLSRDYEANPECSRATLQIATLHRWLNRLKPKPSLDPPFRYRKP